MARAPTKEQSRFGPAQSRAGVFSIFAQARPDQNAGRAASNLAEIGQAVATQVGQNEIDQAQEDRNRGLQDFVSGYLEDGQRVADGEIEPTESRYYMAGVEMGRGRRKGRAVWANLTEWQADNPRPGLDSEESYEEWIQRGLDEAQAAADIDPDNMSEAEYGEYVEILNQVRQRDMEAYLGQLNAEADQEAYESFQSDVTDITLNFDPENLNASYDQGLELLAQARAAGLNMDQARRAVLQEFANVARDTGDVSILEGLSRTGEYSRLMTSALEPVRQQLVDSINTEIEAAQYESETQALQAVLDMMQNEGAAAAGEKLSEYFNNGLIRPEVHLNWDQRVYNQLQQEQARAEREAASRREAAAVAHDASTREAALLQALTGGLVAGGFTYVKHDGEAVEVGPTETAEILQARIISASGGLNAQSVARLTALTEETGLRFSIVDNLMRDTLNISIDRLETGEVTQSQRERLEMLIESDANSFGHYLNREEAAQVTTARYLHQTMGYEIPEAFGAAARMAEVNPSQRQVNHWTNEARENLDWDNFTWIWESRYGNFDADTPAANLWSSELGRHAAAIAAGPGGDAAAREYLDRAVDRTMIVNRQPVNAIGPIRGEEGAEFMANFMASVGIGYLAPELEFAHEDSWQSVAGIVNKLTGRAGEWDPDHPELVAALAGQIDVQNVNGGLRFSLGDASAFVPDQEILHQHARFLEYRQRMDADALDQALLREQDMGWWAENTAGIRDRIRQLDRYRINQGN